MSKLIVDIDGTLTTSGDTPNQPFIDWLRSQHQDFNEEVIIVSARLISRLDETRAWLDANRVPHEQVHLNDFSATPGPNVGLEFKRYKYGLLIEQYGADAFRGAIDNDADVRAMARELGLTAYTPDEAMSSTLPAEENSIRVIVEVPDFIQQAAAQGITYVEQGLAGDGLQAATIEEARQLRAGRVDDGKVTRMRAWILRHRQDWEGVPQNSDEENPDFPGPGAVAAYLWGIDPTEDGAADNVLQWADGVLNAAANNERFTPMDMETRSLPLADFAVTEDASGQKTFTGYAALFNQPSSGLPFTEVIAPGAFKRTLARVADGKRIISFLFGHDETRALATTASGRLQLAEDERGLRVEAKLDPADPDAASVISKLTNEATAMGMSFGFAVPKNGDSWNGDTRTLSEIALYEVSVLSAGQQPAYPSTLGLTAVRKLSADKIGVDAERLMTTLENIKAANELSADDIQVIDQVREKLAPKRKGIDPSVAAAKLKLAQLTNDTL